MVLSTCTASTFMVHFPIETNFYHKERWITNERTVTIQQKRPSSSNILSINLSGPGGTRSVGLIHVRLINHIILELTNESP